MQRSARQNLQQHYDPEDPDDRDLEHSENRSVYRFLKPWLLSMWDTLCTFLTKVNQNKEVWKFLGLTSTLVGFITFAITPPFNKLLHHGLWGGFGMVIYCALGISVCCVMLCTPQWRVSKSKVLTAHIVFFVLMLVTVYSFIVDKMEGDTEKKGWEKMLNMISCGAFSFMSLSLSRLTGLGFEAGVFNFFLGSLMMAVMSWNWKFGFVSAIFCYILFIIDTNWNSEMEQGGSRHPSPMRLENKAHDDISSDSDTDIIDYNTYNSNDIWAGNDPYYG